jgi:hypothetical protein
MASVKSGERESAGERNGEKHKKEGQGGKVKVRWGKGSSTYLGHLGYVISMPKGFPNITLNGCRLGAATALGLCAETLAREPTLQGQLLGVLQGCVSALRVADKDPPGSGAGPAAIDAIRVTSLA